MPVFVLLLFCHGPIDFAKGAACSENNAYKIVKIRVTSCEDVAEEVNKSQQQIIVFYPDVVVYSCHDKQ